MKPSLVGKTHLIMVHLAFACTYVASVKHVQKSFSPQKVSVKRTVVLSVC